MGIEREYALRRELLDHTRRDWRSAHDIRRGIYDFIELDYSKVKGLTAKSIPYAGATGYLTEDNAELSWDYSTDTLNIGTISISDGSIIDSGGSINFGNENLITTGTFGSGLITTSSGITNTTGALTLNDDAGQNITCFASAGAGENPYVYIYGYKTGIGVKYLRLRTEADGDALIEAEGDLNILAGGGDISFGNENLLTTGTLGCGTITVANGSSINLQEDITFTGATTENQILFPDNLADAFSFKEGANFYQTFITTNGSEAIQFHKPVVIGTAATGQMLDVAGDSNPAIEVYNTKVAEVDAVSVLNFRANTSTTSRLAGQIYGGFSDVTDATRTSYIRFATVVNGVFDNRMTIADGRVGIGIAIPLDKVHIYGGNLIVEDSNADVYISLGTTGGLQGYIYATDGGEFGFLDADGNWWLRHDTDVSIIFAVNDVTGMTLDNAGALTVVGCVADGTCEIMKNENAVDIIDYILRTGTGKRDEYNHERMDMQKIYGRYPFLIYESIDVETGKKTYFDKLGAKGDLAYAAILELNERINFLEKENVSLQNRIQQLEA